MMKIVFFNEFNLFQNNSAGITVRSLFGDDLCYNSTQIVYKNKSVYVEHSGQCLLEGRMSLMTLIKLLSLLKKENFDIIYTTGNSNKALLVLALIKVFSQRPILVHYFDNWREFSSPIYKNLILKVITGKKEISLVISDEMGAHYRNRYHGEFVTLMVGTINSNLNKSDTIKTTAADVVFLYAGGFHLGRGRALLEIEKAISHITEYSIKLRILTFKKDFEEYGHSFNKDITEVIVDIPHEKIDFYFKSSDALLFVEPAPMAHRLFLQYSMSTKIPEYLSSGLPIICYGHPDIASVNFFKKTKSAYLIANKEELENELLRFCTKNVHKSIILNAQRTAHKYFSRDRQQQLLFYTINRIIKHSMG